MNFESKSEKHDTKNIELQNTASKQYVEKLTNSTKIAVTVVSDLLIDEEDDSDRLGGTMAIKHTQRNGERKIIPGNHIHDQLNHQQNEYRETFYKIDNGIYLNEPFPLYYSKIRKQIIQKQDDARAAKKVNKDEKDSQLEECIGSPCVVLIEQEPEQPHNVYPNFATAMIGFVKDNKLYSELISIPRQSQGDNGHSEIQIFAKAEDFLKTSKQYQDAEVIILDINSALGMCSNCYKQAERFIEEYDNVKIRFSFNFHYIYMKAPLNNKDRLYHRQIELPSDYELVTDILDIDKIIISGGYSSSPKHKRSVEETDLYFIFRARKESEALTAEMHE